MRKIITMLLFLIGSLFAQKELDWSNVTVNYPISKDDTLSIVYADSGETIKALYINKMLRANRIMQNKVGIGSSTPSAPGQFLTVSNDGSTTSWTVPTYNFQWQILAPTIAYQKGDSLLFVKCTIDENVYYDLSKIISAFTNMIHIDSIWIMYKGDVASYVDSIKLYSVVDNLESNMSVGYSYIIPLQCTGSTQTGKYPINFSINENRPILLRIWYNVSSYIYTIHFRIFAKAT